MRAVRSAQIDILDERDFLQNVPSTPPLLPQRFAHAYPIAC